MITAALEAAAAHPLLGLVVTLIVYSLALEANRVSGGAIVTHPVLLSVSIIGSAILLFGLSYERYFATASVLHLALPPAFALFAVPLWRHAPEIRARARLILPTLAFAGATSVAAGFAVAEFFAAGREMATTLALKSSTAAVAVGAAEAFGGLPALAAIVAILTGITGAAAGPRLLHAVGVVDERAVGLALGITSHAIGTARAFQISGLCGAFATVGLILNALFTVALVLVIFMIL